MTWNLRLLVCLSAVLVACGDDHDHEGDDHADAGPTSTIDAGPGLQGDEYIAGMEKVSSEGHFRVALIESTPIPQDLTLYTWVLEVRDADGQPIDGASVVAEPTMPDHGHGTFPITTPGVTAEGVGRFTLTDMDLFMAGVWQIELRITAGDVSDTAFFHFVLDS